MSGEFSMPAQERLPGGVILGPLNRLVPPVVDSAREAEGGAGLWGLQLPLGVLVHVIARLVGFSAGINAGLLLGEMIDSNGVRSSPCGAGWGCRVGRSARPNVNVLSSRERTFLPSFWD